MSDIEQKMTKYSAMMEEKALTDLGTHVADCGKKITRLLSTEIPRRPARFKCECGWKMDAVRDVIGEAWTHLDLTRPPPPKDSKTVISGIEDAMYILKERRPRYGSALWRLIDAAAVLALLDDDERRQVETGMAKLSIAKHLQEEMKGARG